MATTINSGLSIQLRATKTVTNSDTTATPPSIQMSLGNVSKTWDSSTSPDGTEAWSGIVTLSSGAATIDLTSLTQTGLTGTQTMSGLKLRAIHLFSPTTNANAISIATGASNGYTVLGTVSVIYPGDSVVRTTLNASAVDGTHKTWDVAGTGSQVLHVLAVFGS